MSREIQLQALKGIYRIRHGNAAASHQLSAMLSDSLAYERYASIANRFRPAGVSLEPFVKSLRSADTVESAAAVLALIGGFRAAKILVDSLIDWHRLDDRSWSSLRAGVKTIGNDAAEAIRPWLQRGDGTVQWRAATLLSDIGCQGRDAARIAALTEPWSKAKDLGIAALPTLAAKARSGGFEWRFNAVRAIEGIAVNQAAVAKALLQAGTEFDTRRQTEKMAANQAAAVGALLDIRMERNVLADGSFPLLVRRRAADAIEALGAFAIPVLQSAAGSPDARLRREAISLLGRIRGAPGGEIVSALGDADPMVRCEAALALGRLRDPANLDALLETADSADASLKSASAWALGEIGDTRAAEFLAAAAEDPDEDVRHAAAIALEKLQHRTSTS